MHSRVKPNALRASWTVALRIAGSLALGVALAFCASSDSVVEPPPAHGVDAAPRVATSIRVLLPQDLLAVGDSMVAQLLVLDAAGDPIIGRQAEWSSTDENVASVTPNSVVTARAIGRTSISAKLDGLSASAVLETYPATGQVATPELPRVLLDTRLIPPTGNMWRVRPGDDLQRAIDQAQRGDVILLDAGATYTGNFVLREKPGTGWVTIRTSASDAELPPEGSRIRPEVHRPVLALLQTANAGKSVIITAPGASGYRLVGLEIAARGDVQSLFALIQFGDGGVGQRTLESVPSDLVLDRSYIHGHDGLNLQRCLTLNSASSAVVDSYLSECHAKGSDSQAIIGWNGPGPFKIVNNYLEGAGENVMFGGADPRLPELMPADIEIRGNHFFKPLAWKGRWTIKNLFELKLGRRILVEGNVFEQCWIDGQTGFALLFKSVNQGGNAPWSQTSDVTVRYNVVRRSAAGITIAGRPEKYPAIPAARFLIEHNVFYEIGDYADTPNGRMIMLLNELRDVEIRYNTLLHNANVGAFVLFADAGPSRGLVLRDNIATKGGEFGAVIGSAVPQGVQALSKFAQTYTFANNVLVGLPANFVGMYPANNFFVASLDAVQFADVMAGDYRLTPSSPFYSAGTSGASPGADWAAVAQRVGGVVLLPP